MRCATPNVRASTLYRRSDIHLKYKLKKSRQQVLDEACTAVRTRRWPLRRRRIFREEATRTDWDYLLEEISRAVVAMWRKNRESSGHRRLSRYLKEYAALIGRMVKALGDTAIVVFIVMTIWNNAAKVFSRPARGARRSGAL